MSPSIGTKILRIAGRAVPLPGNDIDTDQIVPSRFLKSLSFEGLGKYAFYDERYALDGTPKTHPLDEPAFAGANVLLVNANFGCGSSREQASQAIARMGIEAIVGESFAEIFQSNCTAIGLPAVTVASDVMAEAMETARRKPATSIVVDLKEMHLKIEEHTFSCDLPAEYRGMLMEGTWDSTSTLLNVEQEIHATARRLPYITGTY